MMIQGQEGRVNSTGGCRQVLEVVSEGQGRGPQKYSRGLQVSLENPPSRECRCSCGSGPALRAYCSGPRGFENAGMNRNSHQI